MAKAGRAGSREYGASTQVSAGVRKLRHGHNRLFAACRSNARTGGTSLSFAIRFSDDTRDRRGTLTALADYARVPIVFTVDCVLDVTNRDDGRAGSVLSERRLDAPDAKDYDAITGDGPLQWAGHVDLSNWALFSARLAGRIVGGAAAAARVLCCSKESRHGLSCRHAGSTSGRDASCGRFIARRILPFQRRRCRPQAFESPSLPAQIVHRPVFLVFQGQESS